MDEPTTGKLLLAAFRLMARSNLPDGDEIAIHLTFTDARVIATQVDALVAERDALAKQVRQVKALCEPAYRLTTQAEPIPDDYERGTVHALDDLYRTVFLTTPTEAGGPT